MSTICVGLLLEIALLASVKSSKSIDIAALVGSLPPEPPKHKPCKTLPLRRDENPWVRMQRRVARRDNPSGGDAVAAIWHGPAAGGQSRLRLAGLLFRQGFHNNLPDPLSGHERSVVFATNCWPVKQVRHFPRVLRIVINGRRVARAAIVLGAALWSGVCPLAAEEPAGSPPKDLRLFLLIGQSNMAGRGKVEPQDQVTDPRIWMLTKDLRWIPAKDPVHFDKPTAGVGLCSEFARTLVRKNGKCAVGLIPCAVGGTPLDAWLPGGKENSLYNTAVARTKEALKSGRLAGILWIKGERPGQARMGGELRRAVPHDDHATPQGSGCGARAGDCRGVGGCPG